VLVTTDRREVMKKRNGFVSNSSSSSFILFLDKNEKTKNKPQFDGAHHYIWEKDDDGNFECDSQYYVDIRNKISKAKEDNKLVIEFETEMNSDYETRELLDLLGVEYISLDN
jgi:hypothetical protein